MTVLLLPDYFLDLHHYGTVATITTKDSHHFLLYSKRIAIDYKYHVSNPHRNQHILWHTSIDKTYNIEQDSILFPQISNLRYAGKQLSYFQSFREKILLRLNRFRWEFKTKGSSLVE